MHSASTCVLENDPCSGVENGLERDKPGAGNPLSCLLPNLGQGHHRAQCRNGGGEGGAASRDLVTDRLWLMVREEFSPGVMIKTENTPPTRTQPPGMVAGGLMDTFSASV